MTTTEHNPNDIPPAPITRHVQVRAFDKTYTKELGQSRERAMANLTRQQCFDQGYLTVKDLDDEELVAGKCRDGTGVIPRINGKTDLIPRERYDEMVQEFELRFKQKLRLNLDKAIDTMVDIMSDDTAEPRDRLDAAKYVFERTAGKTPETVNINVKTAPWEDVLNAVTGIASITREQHRQAAAGIVDVEYEEMPDDQNQSMDTEDAGTSGLPGPVQGPQMWQEPNDKHGPDTQVPGEPRSGQDVDGRDGADPDDIATTHDNVNVYGRRADEKRSYAQQARDAQEVALRRAEARTSRQAAKKQRKIARALGADKIKDEITGATIGDDGKILFE